MNSSLDEADADSQQDPKEIASEKLHEWWGEVKEMQDQVQQFQAEANEKSVDELVHLARVKDLLAELQQQVPEYTPPPPALNWGYGKGPDGPANWANLSPDFQVCATGKAQSPINVELDLTAAELPSLGWQLDGGTPFKVKANKGSSALTGREFYDGHTFEVDDLGEPVMTVDGVDYVLEEFHFHTPSEHAVAGKHYDAEIQFVHVEKSQQGSNDPNARRLIAAAFFEKGERSPAFIEQLVTEAVPKATANPQELVELQFESIAQTVLVGSVPSRPQAAKEFLPNFKDYFQYSGSLSTPPCTETVTWVIFKNAITINAEHLVVLSNLEGANNRPLQALNGRQVLDNGDGN